MTYAELEFALDRLRMLNERLAEAERDTYDPHGHNARLRREIELEKQQIIPGSDK